MHHFSNNWHMELEYIYVKMILLSPTHLICTNSEVVDFMQSCDKTQSVSCHLVFVDTHLDFLFPSIDI